MTLLDDIPARPSAMTANQPNQWTSKGNPDVDISRA
jgi:hypothetical protein